LPLQSAALSLSGLPSNITYSFSDPNPELVPNGNGASNLTITAGPRAYGQTSPLWVTATANGLAAQTSLSIKIIGSTHTYNLQGSYTQGWNITVIKVTQGDILVLHLISGDSADHAFFVDYNGNKVPDAGEPYSGEFSSSTVPLTFAFNVTQVGTLPTTAFSIPTR
jgi:hypothetical protein